jgi:acetyl/propionyl-CoA carboxylase alpha subunit
MKLIAELKEDQYQIHIKRNGSEITAEIDGRVYELEASEPEANVYLLKMDGQIIEVFVSPGESLDQPFQVRTGNNDFEINLIDPRNLRSTLASGGATDGIVEIKTAMPGKVVRVLMKEGEEVQSGQGVIIVEAMKMQNEMKSPKDGHIKEIKVDEGDTVNAGDILVLIE